MPLQFTNTEERLSSSKKAGTIVFFSHIVVGTATNRLGNNIFIEWNYTSLINGKVSNLVYTVNPFKPNELAHPYQWDEPITNLGHYKYFLGQEKSYLFLSKANDRKCSGKLSSCSLASLGGQFDNLKCVILHHSKN